LNNYPDESPAGQKALSSSRQHDDFGTFLLRSLNMDICSHIDTAIWSKNDRSAPHISLFRKSVFHSATSYLFFLKHTHQLIRATISTKAKSARAGLRLIRQACWYRDVFILAFHPEEGM